MRNLLLSLTFLGFLLGTARADYFFLPPRDLFNQRPDYYVYGFHPGFYPRVYPPFAYYPLLGRLPGFISGHAPRTAQIVVHVPQNSELIRANYSDLIFRVSPSRAHIYVDDKLIGSARDFATDRDRYTILEGMHYLRIDFPGFIPYETEVEIVPNRTLHLDIELQPLPGKP